VVQAVEGFCEHGDEPSASGRVKEFLDRVSKWQLLDKNVEMCEIY